VAIGLGVHFGMRRNNNDLSANNSNNSNNNNNNNSSSSTPSSTDPSNFSKDPKLKNVFYGVSYTLR